MSPLFSVRARHFGDRGWNLRHSVIHKMPRPDPSITPSLPTSPDSPDTDYDGNYDKNPVVQPLSLVDWLWSHRNHLSVHYG